jgi:hypothetical protein
MKRVLVACAILVTLVHFDGPKARAIARTFGDCVALDVLPDGIADWHSECRVFRAPCFGLCPDLGSAE